MLDIINAALSPFITELVGIVVTAAVGYGLKLLRDKTGIEVEAKHRDALQSAMTTGVLLAVARLGPAASDEALRREILKYVHASVPDEIKRLKPTDGVLADLATAKAQAVIGGKQER